MSRPNTVTVDFGDGKERELRYSIAATKKLVADYGDAQKILALPFFDFLPVLLGGLVEKNVTLAELEEIVTMPQAQYLISKFIEAFTGKTVDQHSAEAEAKNAQSSQIVQ
jgi:hypothetical protein